MTPEHLRRLAPVLGLVLAAGCAAAPAPGSPPLPARATTLAPAPAPPEMPAAPPATAVTPPPSPPVPAAPGPPPGPAPPPVAVPPPEPSSPAPDAARVADEQLAALVERTLAADPMLQSAVIEAEVHAGQVILKGTVPSYRERARAVDLALRVPGVRSVRLRLVLQPP